VAACVHTSAVGDGVGDGVLRRENAYWSICVHACVFVVCVCVCVCVCVLACVCVCAEERICGLCGGKMHSMTDLVEHKKTRENVGKSKNG